MAKSIVDYTLPQPLVNRYPNIIPKYESGGFDDTATGGGTLNWKRFGTANKNLTAGYGRSPYDGNFVYGDYYNESLNLPTISKTFNTPIGSLDIDTNYDAAPGVSATLNFNDNITALYNKLVDNYSKNKEFIDSQKEYQPKQIPLILR